MREHIAVHGIRELPHRGIHLCLGSADAVEPDLRLDLCDAIEITFFECGFYFREPFERRHIEYEAGWAGTDHDQRTHSFGVRKCEVHRDAAAHRTAHQNRRLVDVQMREQYRQIAQMSEIACDGFALAVAAQVETDHTITCGEVDEFVVPLPAVRHTGVNHHERLAAAGSFIVDTRTIDRREAAFKVTHLRTPYVSGSGGFREKDRDLPGRLRLIVVIRWIRRGARRPQTFTFGSIGDLANTHLRHVRAIAYFHIRVCPQVVHPHGIFGLSAHRAYQHVSGSDLDAHQRNFSYRAGFVSDVRDDDARQAGV